MQGNQGKIQPPQRKTWYICPNKIFQLIPFCGLFFFSFLFSFVAAFLVKGKTVSKLPQVSPSCSCSFLIFLDSTCESKKGSKTRVLQNSFGSINQWLQCALQIVIVGDIFILQRNMLLLYFKLEAEFIVMTNLCWLEWPHEWCRLYRNAALKIYREKWKIKRHWGQ